MKNILFWLGLLVGVGILLTLLTFGVKVRQVKCYVNDQAVKVDFPVCRQLQTVIGSRLMFRDFYHDEMVASLLYEVVTQEAYTLIRLEKSLAGTVTFFLSDQPPLYRIQQEEAKWLVSQSGSKRENNDQVAVPLVVDLAGLYDREPLVHQFLAAFLAAAGETRSRIVEIRLVSAERIEILIPGFPMAVVELQQNPRLAATQLVIIIRKLNPREIDVAIRELDLRFDLPVLRTAVSSDSGQVILDSQE